MTANVDGARTNSSLASAGLLHILGSVQLHPAVRVP
jgi:hypothetical protein